MKINLLDDVSEEVPSFHLEADGECCRSQLGRVREWVCKKWAALQPWQEFLSAKKFSKPNNMADVTQRLMLNLKHYKANYTLIFAVLISYCIVISPLLLVGLLLACCGCYYISTRGCGQAIRMLGRDFSVPEQYALVLIMSLPVFSFAAAGSAVFWIIGSSIVIVGFHASFMTIRSPPADQYMEMNGVEVK